MPVKHDLYQDLGLSKEKINGRRAENSHLNALFDKYAEIDHSVVSAEEQNDSDEKVKALKDKRLALKDEIKKLLG